MFIRCMSGHEVETDTDSFRMCIANQLDQLRVGSETRVYFVVVGDVVTAVFKRTFENGAQPDGVESAGFHVIEPAADTFEVADTVAIAILKTRGVDVVYHSAFEPFGAALGVCRRSTEQGDDEKWE